MKTKMTHTKGPWKYEGAKDRRTHARLIWGPEGVAADAVATAEDFNSYERDGEVEANARLIAAAPDMLAALSALLGAVNGETRVNMNGDGFFKDHAKAFDAARAAIAKAEGK